MEEESDAGERPLAHEHRAGGVDMGRGKHGNSTIHTHRLHGTVGGCQPDHPGGEQELGALMHPAGPSASSPTPRIM